MSAHPAPLLGEPLPIELANTRFAARGQEHEGLESPADLRDWLSEVRGRLPLVLDDHALDAIGTADLTAARELRDALRELLGSATAGRTLDPGAVDALNRTIRAAPSWVELDPRERAAATRSAASPARAALAAIAQEGVGLLTGDDAGALRACAAPGCMLFYRKDHPRRAWCSPRCSDRVRAARYYARRSTDSAGPPR